MAGRRGKWGTLFPRKERGERGASQREEGVQGRGKEGGGGRRKEGKGQAIRIDTLPGDCGGEEKEEEEREGFN